MCKGASPLPFLPPPLLPVPSPFGPGGSGGGHGCATAATCGAGGFGPGGGGGMLPRVEAAADAATCATAATPDHRLAISVRPKRPWPWLLAPSGARLLPPAGGPRGA